MSTWWLAIDRNYTSYDELKYRKVVAQGWPGIGDLKTLCALVPANEKDAFLTAVAALSRVNGDAENPAGRVMWDLFKIRSGDLVVGIEGVNVKGVCELTKNGWESYRYDSPEAYNYAQTIGFPVEWIDWDPVFGPPPVAPAHGVQGVAGLQAESHRVAEAWAAYQAKPQS